MHSVLVKAAGNSQDFSDVEHGKLCDIYSPDDDYQENKN